MCVYVCVHVCKSPLIMSMTLLFFPGTLALLKADGGETLYFYNPIQPNRTTTFLKVV